MTFLKNTAIAFTLGATGFGSTASADVVHLDDVIIDGSLCVGQDCVNGESFGFDTIRLKENNVRIRFDDTSASASFPNRDWQLTANDSSNGGANKFSIEDITGGRIPFTIEAGAPNNSLFVDDGGRLGVGTATPNVNVHTKTGNTPTLRLEQDGSSGFAAQTWDVAGNETNFFVRDASNGSTLPFRIEPGTPSNAIYVDSTGNIGMGTTSPDEALHVMAGNIKLEQAGPVNVTFSDSSDPGNDVRIQHQNGTLRFSFVGSGVSEMELDTGGNLILAGGLISNGGGGACTVADPCDRVFDTSVYEVPSIEDHAKEMWAKKHLPAVGPTGPGQPLDVTLKLVRMLNELEHAHIYIEQLNQRISELEANVQKTTLIK